jgi:hypothetical protein
MIYINKIKIKYKIKIKCEYINTVAAIHAWCTIVLYLTIQFNLQSKWKELSCEHYLKLRDSQINAMFSSRNVSNIIIYTTVQKKISQNKRFLSNPDTSCDFIFRV